MDSDLERVLFICDSRGRGLDKFLRISLNFISFINMIVEDQSPRCMVAPITGMDLLTYNKGQMAGTTYSIDIQQNMLNELITEINKFIVYVNSANNVITPWVSRSVHKRNRNNMCHHYHKLAADGCHLTDDLRIEWADSLSVAILNNSK